MVFFVSLIFGCGEPKSLIDKEIAPHQIEESSVEYSKKELKKLHDAEGETLKIFQKDKLDQYLEGGRTIVFNINKTADGKWLNQTQKLELMHAKFEDTFELVHLFIADKDISHEQMSLYLRRHNLAAPAFYLEDISILTNQSDWKGDIPAVLIQNEIDGINLLYEQFLTQEELLTILQIVTL